MRRVNGVSDPITLPCSLARAGNEQLKELSTNSMLETVCPSLSTLAKACLTIPVGTAFENDKNQAEDMCVQKKL